jgi:hypothetical protein
MKISKNKLKKIIFNLNSTLLKENLDQKDYLTEKLNLLNNASELFNDVLAELQKAVELDQQFSKDFQPDTKLVYDSLKQFKTNLEVLIDNSEELLK